MKLNIPSASRRILQDNGNQFNGNIIESFNLDLDTDKGYFGITRTKKVDDFVNINPAVQTFMITNINVATARLFFLGVSSGNRGFYQGEETPFSSSGNFVSPSGSSLQIDFSPGLSDLIIANDKIYATEGNNVTYAPISSLTFTDINSPALDDTTPHLLTSFDDKVYVTNLDYKVGYINTSNVLTLTGSNTLDLNMPGYTITVFMTGLDRVWIGLSSLQNGQLGTTYIYEWDGASQIPTQRYEIDASGLICGIVKNGIPYVLDTNGRLLAYSGATFIEVAKLPYKKGELMSGFNTNQLNNRAIHPRSITVDGDEILINVSNRVVSSSTSDTRWADFPAGVWAYSEDNGLYHKYSASNQDIADTGTTNITDWGQQRIPFAGAIFVNDSIVSLEEPNEGGRVIFCQRYFVGAGEGVDVSDNNTTFKTALFTDDTKNNTQKYGYFITRELHTEEIEETWQKIYLKHRKLINASDEIVVKYRGEIKPKTTDSISWVNTKTINTSADLSDFTQGHEMQVIQGIGSGKSFTIESIVSTGSGYTVTLKEEFTEATGTAIAQFTNFMTIGNSSYNEQVRQKGFTISHDNISPMAQFKVCMQFTGEDQLYGVQIISKSNIKE